VLAKEATTNRVVVGSREQLATRRVRLRDATLHRDAARADRVRLRYRSAPVRCRLRAGDDELWAELAEPAFGVAPGQTACLMAGSVVIGSATIAA
jgi:tRNA-specific 2-thiouridylase